MTDHDEDVVDLTISFTLADHCNLANEVIVIDTDDSFEASNVRAKKSNKPKKSLRVRKSSANTTTSPNEKCVANMKRKSNQIGSCPICWEELGKNPLVSTKCGHVFCLKCLERSLKVEKRCPNCRIILKGASAYHRLYLSV
ncbi:putative RING finger protein C548.05c [Papilio machaon]|uniref:Putative RING finger protein C548.05c n=1 Tax=Papilio machaon TaxID=76193 RepID=A0A194QQ25_PAPMA|nr:putative RING finger protein C548.05c [Papilio machaon]